MTEELRLYAFNCGWFQCRPGYFVEGDEGDYLRGPVPSYLIDHPKGRALFDTGMGERYRRGAETALPANKFGLQWFEGMDIATRLRAIDIDPASINWIVNSHLHIDHCGGNAHLPNATVLVQQRELEVAERNPEAGLYEAIDYDTGQRIFALHGEHDLFGDGSVMIVPTYGHTPGHQSVVVKLAKGEVLLAGDCCYTERNLDTMVLPRATVDLDAGKATFERLARMRSAGTRILYGHDGRQWASIRENALFE